MATGTTDTALHGGGHGDGHGDHPKWLQHHYDTPTQQFETAKLGMWVFIATEILMFGGLFVAYGIFKGLEPNVFQQAHHHLNKVMGAANTVVLLFSSLTAAMAVRSAQTGKRNQTTAYIVITLICACVFLVVKYFEYEHKFHDGLLPGRFFHNDELPARAHMFFALYFMMTGLHGLHVLIGMSVLVWVLRRNIRGDFSPEYFTAVEIGALYWHLVDLVWIYLFPLLYLVS